MDWGERLLDLALGGVALSLGTDLAHVKRTAQARLGEFNPLRNISANHDLLRALRLAWVRAAMDVLDHARVRLDEPEWHSARADAERFDVVARPALRALRSAAFNRNAHPGETAIDASLQAVLDGAAEFIGAAAGRDDDGRLGRGFAPTLAAVTGWPEAELPPTVLAVASDGIALAGHRGEPRTVRTFGDLVFAEFADLIKDPDKYPQAGAAFGIAMQHALRTLAQDTLTLLRGIDARLDAALPQLDALDALRAALAQQAGAQARLEAAVAAVPDSTVDALMRRLAADGALSGIERRTLIALAQRLTRDEVRDVDRAVKELEHAVDVAARVMAHADAAASGGTFVAGVLADVASATRAGDIDAGSDRVDAALAELDRDEDERRRALQQSRRTLIEAGVQQELLRRDAHAAARRLEALAALTAPAAPAASAEYAERARGFFCEGRDKGVNLPLQVALEMALRMRDAATDDAARRAAIALQADALDQLGEREVDPARLEQAVALRREVLASTDRAADGRAWAAAQGALGGSLHTLGWRVYDRAILFDSIAAQRAEIDACPRADDPLGWAAAQHRLGRALYALGFREGDAALLREAVAALDAALGERTRSRAPREWAATQSVKGVALSMLGRLQGSLATSRSAVAAYREALRERRADEHPVEWAATTTNLSLVLIEIGEATRDVAPLDEAIAGLDAVARRRPRDDCALEWALAQHNVGGAWTLRAQLLDGDVESLQHAVTALRSALQEFDRERTPVYWTASQSDLSTALTALGRRQCAPALLADAVAAAEAALALRHRADAPLEWANSQLVRAQAWHALADIAADAAAATTAADAYSAALTELTAERRPGEYAIARDGLAAVQRFGDDRAAAAAAADQPVSRVTPGSSHA